MGRKTIVILALLTATAAFAYLYPAYSRYSGNFKYEIRYEERGFDTTEDRISGIEFGCKSCSKNLGVPRKQCELNFELLTRYSNGSKVECAREGNNLYIILLREDKCSLAKISGTIYGVEGGRYNLAFIIKDPRGRRVVDKVSFEAGV